MRRFEVAPGGNTPYHTRPWEHEVYFFEGSGVAVGKDGEYEVGPGSVVLTLPDEKHNFKPLRIARVVNPDPNPFFI